MAKEILAGDTVIVQKLIEKNIGNYKITDIKRMGGLTNRTYLVSLSDNNKYVVRIPGEGTEELIVRSDEKKSTELACSLGIDAKLLHFGEDGSKITEYIKDAVTMSAETMKEKQNISDAAHLFRKLHTCGKDTGVRFEVFEMAAGYEKIIYEKNVPMYSDYTEIKNRIMDVKKQIDNIFDIKKVPCHNDALCENWVRSQGGRMYLIDWEYAGMNDGIWDLADVSIEASYDKETDIYFLSEYLGHSPTNDEMKHFLANKLYVDYLWTLWAKARVPYDGQAMEDWALERYERLKKNLEEFSKY